MAITEFENEATTEELAAASLLRQALNECYQVGISTPDMMRVVAEYLHQEAGDSDMCVPELLKATALGIKRVVYEVWEMPGYAESVEPDPVKVLITVEGGAVQWIAGTAPIAPVVFDYDQRDAGEEHRRELIGGLIEPGHWDQISYSPDCVIG